MDDNGNPIDGLTVNMTLTSALVGISYLNGVAQCNACWSLQLNAVAPSGKAAGLEQFVAGYYNSEIGLSMDYFEAGQGGSDFILTSGAPYIFLPQTDLVAGFRVSMSLIVNSTDNVLGFEANYFSGSGQNIATQIATIASAQTVINNGYTAAELGTTIVGWQLNLVGEGNGDSATFTSGAGTFSYSSPTPFTYTVMKPDTLSYTGFNGDANGAFTAETSNQGYLLPSLSQASTSTTQSTTTKPSTSPTQSCIDSSTVTCTALPATQGLTIDAGPAVFSYSASKISWASSGSNVTLAIPTLLLGVGPSAIITTHCSPTFSTTFTHNSTTYIWTLVAASAVLCLTASLTPVMHVYVRNVTGSYNEKEIVVTGTTTRTGTAVLLQNQISFSLASSSPKAVCDTGCTSERFGSAVFDWSGVIGAAVAYNNQTGVLSVTQPSSLLASASYLIDPVALDGSGACTQLSGSGTCTITFTTSNANDVLYCYTPTTYLSGGGLYPIITKPMDNKGNTWHNRVAPFTWNSGSSDFNSTSWYATWTGSGSITITVGDSGNASYLEASCWGISGANTASPFDTGTNVGTSSANCGTCSITFSTNNANDILLSSTGMQGYCSAAPTGASGTWTKFAGTCGQQGNAYVVVSSTQSSVSVTWGAGSHGGMIFDAIKAAAAGPTIIQSKSCTGTGSTGTCAYTSNTAAGDTSLVLAFDTVSTAVSSVTDSQSLSYQFIVSEDSGVIGDAEGWYACSTLTAAADTVTTHYSVSVTWAIILYELSATDCAVSSSTGTGAGSTAPTVTAYVPQNPSLVIGGLASTIAVGGSCTGGASYTVDQSISPTVLTTDCSEHITNLGTSETTPFVTPSTSYNEVSMGFQSAGAAITTTESFSPSISLSESFAQTAAITNSPSISLSGSMVQTVQPGTFSTGVSVSPTFSPTVTVAGAFSPSVSLSATMNQQVQIGNFTAGIILTPIFIGVPCVGCFNSTTITTTTTSTVTTGGGGTDIWYILVPFLLMGMVIAFGLAAKRRR